jgi:hypothetical protein
MNRAADPASASVWSAIQQGDARALDEHLKVPGTLTNQHAAYGTTPLTWAALTGRKELAVLLNERGASVMDRNRDGGTALHAAAFMGEADVVDLLVQKGADVNATLPPGPHLPADDPLVGMTPLQYARHLRKKKAVEALEAGSVGRIVLSRPAVDAGESIGFLPGDMEDKLAPYLRPLFDALADRLSMKRVRALMAEGAIEIAPLASCADAPSTMPL